MRVSRRTLLALVAVLALIDLAAATGRSLAGHKKKKGGKKLSVMEQMIANGKADIAEAMARQAALARAAGNPEAATLTKLALQAAREARAAGGRVGQNNNDGSGSGSSRSRKPGPRGGRKGGRKSGRKSGGRGRRGGRTGRRDNVGSGGSSGGKASNVYTTYHYYAPLYETSSLYCADVFQAPGYNKKALLTRPWTAYCNDNGLGPMSQDKCGRSLCVKNPVTGQTVQLVVVDMCGQGGIDVDPLGFNAIDKNKAGVRDGHMNTIIWWC